MDGDKMKAFLDANNLRVIPRDIVPELIKSLESLKSSKEGAIFEAANFMNDACVTLVKRYLDR